MTDLVYGISAYERQRGNFPELPVVNMLAEPVPSEPGVTLQSRPGLSDTSIVMGSLAVKGLFKADGVLDNDLFGVGGTTLYRNSTSLGGINGTGPVSFAGYSNYIFVNAGQDIWAYDGATLTSIAFPDSADVSKIVVGASRLVAIRESTGQFYWSEPLGVTIDPLAFATAENSPDTLKDMLFIGDKLILFGAETIEFWPITDDADLPFAPLVGAVLPVGIKGTGMATTFNRGFAWITNFNEVCVNEPENIISSPYLQIKIAESTSTSVWTFYVDDNEYLVIQTDSETWVYGARTQTWSQLESNGYDNWLPTCFDGDVFGTSISGTLVEWGDDYEDFGGVLERRFRAWLPITSEAIRVSNIILRTNPGTTPYLTGFYLEPAIELRTSRDGGFEWQDWKRRSLGVQGKYLRKTFWSSLGQFSYPGLLIELRVTDPVPFRVSGMAMNEPFGGR
jgi:hypothetical protein